MEPEAAARLAGLLYVTDEMPGVRRQARGRGFAYYDPDGKLIRDSGELVRFRSIGVPPAWTDVWICPLPEGHVQATGRDARRRKQYRYHVSWRSFRDATKFHRMSSFGHALPRLRERIGDDLGRRRLDRERVLAAVLRIVDDTLIRVGNEEYARENQTFGATTLQDEHATVTASKVVLEFRGKHGKLHHAEVADPRVARVVRGCQELPGQHLFAYVDDDGAPVAVTSEAVERVPARHRRGRLLGQGLPHLGRLGGVHPRDEGRASARSRRRWRWSPGSSATRPPSRARRTSTRGCCWRRARTTCRGRRSRRARDWIAGSPR